MGWLGDATIPTDNGSVSFGNDDYIADLDADNIAHRVDYGSGVTAMEAFNNYYDDMNNSNDADAFRMTSGNPRFFKCRDESVKSNRMRK